MGRPFTAKQSLGTTRYQTSMSWTEKILKCQFMQIIRFFLEYLWRWQNVIFFFLFSFFYFYIYILFRFFLHSIAFSSFIRALPVYACFNFTGYHFPWANPGTSPALRARGWGDPVPGVGGWGKSKIYSLWFCEVRVISRAVYTMATRWLFLRKNAGICWRVWLERNNLSKLKYVYITVCFKIWN